MRYWWEEDEARRARFFRNVLGFVEPPPALCDARIAHTIVQQHMESPSVLAIFPVQVHLILLVCIFLRFSHVSIYFRNKSLVVSLVPVLQRAGFDGIEGRV